MGGRVRVCRRVSECITVRPLLTSALTKTSLDRTSSFFCSSPCKFFALECQREQVKFKNIIWIMHVLIEEQDQSILVSENSIVIDAWYVGSDRSTLQMQVKKNGHLRIPGPTVSQGLN